MKIPLIVSLDLTKCEAPGIYLHHGNWTISGVEADGLILGTSDGPLPVFNGMKIRGDNYVRVKVGSCNKSIKQTIEATLC